MATNCKTSFLIRFSMAKKKKLKRIILGQLEESEFGL